MPEGKPDLQDETTWPDYCRDGFHVAFPPGRVCYCGAVFFVGDLVKQ